jgi:hypothetical protein
MPSEKRLLAFAITRSGEGHEVGVAEATLDRHRLDRFAAYGTRLAVIGHRSTFTMLNFRFVLCRVAPADSTAEEVWHVDSTGVSSSLPHSL